MSKTLEETKKYIIETSKQHNLHGNTINKLLKGIKTDKDGNVDDIEFFDIHYAIMQLAEKRENTIKLLKANKRAREKGGRK